jgi:micrococcal nuclease
MNNKGVLFAIVLSSVACPVVAKDTATGQVEISDGDTLRIANIRVRLQGVDAPEMDMAGGSAAKNRLADIVGQQTIRCELTGERNRDRFIAVCYLPDGSDIGAELIRRGAALDCAPFSKGRYASLETVEAKATLARASYCQ